MHTKEETEDPGPGIRQSNIKSEIRNPKSRRDQTISKYKCSKFKTKVNDYNTIKFEE
jgi:hypothetical protein